MDSQQLASILKEWEENEMPLEEDPALCVLAEARQIEERRRQILALSNDLENAYHRLKK